VVQSISHKLGLFYLFQLFQLQTNDSRRFMSELIWIFFRTLNSQTIWRKAPLCKPFPFVCLLSLWISYNRLRSQTIWLKAKLPCNLTCGLKIGVALVLAGAPPLLPPCGSPSLPLRSPLASPLLATLNSCTASAQTAATAAASGTGSGCTIQRVHEKASRFCMFLQGKGTRSSGKSAVR
jgi:hypothetical protein